MKILYVTQYFHPEVGATTNKALANVRYLANEGHDVTILTEMPNPPKGIIFSGYQGKIFVKEQMENYHVNRVWVYTSPKKKFITRILFYITFVKMLYLLSKCQLVLTDSGGLQKEAYLSQKPCLTLREQTEWAKLVENNFNLLADFDKIIDYTEKILLSDMDFGKALYEDGKAGKKIINRLILSHEEN